MNVAGEGMRMFGSLPPAQRRGRANLTAGSGRWLGDGGHSAMTMSSRILKKHMGDGKSGEGYMMRGLADRYHGFIGGAKSGHTGITGNSGGGGGNALPGTSSGRELFHHMVERATRKSRALSGSSYHLAGVMKK